MVNLLRKFISRLFLNKKLSVALYIWYKFWLINLCIPRYSWFSTICSRLVISFVVEERAIFHKLSIQEVSNKSNLDKNEPWKEISHGIELANYLCNIHFSIEDNGPFDEGIIVHSVDNKTVTDSETRVPIAVRSIVASQGANEADATNETSWEEWGKGGDRGEKGIRRAGIKLIWKRWRNNLLCWN